jgi:hypothetical protein
MIGQRTAKPREIVVQSFGEDITLKLRPLSAIEVDAIRQQFPEPTAPRREVDGKTVVDATGPDHETAVLVWWRTFTMAKACRMIGDAEFGTSDIAEQFRLLQLDFTEREFARLLVAVQKMDQGEVTSEDTRRAQDALYPTESGPSSPTETLPA